MPDGLSRGWASVAREWDGVELWLTQQWWPVQVVLLMGVLLPACWVAARGIDRVVDVAAERVARRRRP